MPAPGAHSVALAAPQRHRSGEHPRPVFLRSARKVWFRERGCCHSGRCPPPPPDARRTETMPRTTFPLSTPMACAAAPRESAARKKKRLAFVFCFAVLPHRQASPAPACTPRCCCSPGRSCPPRAHHPPFPRPRRPCRLRRARARTREGEKRAPRLEGAALPRRGSGGGSAPGVKRAGASPSRNQPRPCHAARATRQQTVQRPPSRLARLQNMQNPTVTACAAAPRSLQTLARAGSRRAASGRSLQTPGQSFSS